MIILYVYPQMFGLPDNNPFGLKVDTFLRLSKIEYQLEHILDTKDAPRGQLPYMKDNGEIISDSDHMIQYIDEKYQIHMDKNLSQDQEQMKFLINRMLGNHLYWIMSYSRWQDERYWPLFRAEMIRQTPTISTGILEQAKEYNIKKYQTQGIGRYTTKDIYEFGVDDLKIIRDVLNGQKFMFGNQITSLDASCYGFLANIYFFEIETPLKNFILNEKSLIRYLQGIREILKY